MDKKKLVGKTQKIPHSFIYAITILIIGLAFIVSWLYIQNKNLRITQQESEKTILFKFCEKEVEETIDIVDNFVQSLPTDDPDTPEIAKRLAIRAGIADQNGYVYPKYDLIQKCITEKSKK